MQTLAQYILLTPVILFSLSIHEFAHAWMANKLGDPTAKNEGRLTLNPIKHIDPIGLIAFFILKFGWAKPVPVNPYNFKNLDRDDMLVSAAGPASNFIIALIVGLAIRIWLMAGNIAPAAFYMLRLALFMNLALAIFNLIPVFPLDGSHILRSLLPTEKKITFDQTKHYGPFILIGLIMLGNFTGISILGIIIFPFVNFFTRIFAGI